MDCSNLAMFGFSLIIFDIFRDELSHLEASGWPSQRAPLGRPLGLLDAFGGDFGELLRGLLGVIYGSLGPFGGPFGGFLRGFGGY